MRKPTKQLKLVVRHGIITAIYDDALTALMPDADVKVRRASHVEPDHSSIDGSPCWCADLSPVGGPMLTDLGTRQEALDAEVAYLQKYVIR